MMTKAHTRFNQFIFILALLFSSLLVISTPLFASAVSAPSGKAKLELLSHKTAVDPSGHVWLGLKFSLNPGWKTYWRAPGPVGYPFKLDWSGSENIKHTEVFWPFPERIPTATGPINGYEGEVVFPIHVSLQDKGQQLVARVHVDYLICDIGNCIPQRNDLTLTLPVGKPMRTADAGMIEKYLAAVPKNQAPQDYRIERVDIINHDTIPPIIKLTLHHLTGAFNQNTLPTMFAETYGTYFMDNPSVKLAEGGKEAIYTMAVYPNKFKVPTPLPRLQETRFTFTFGKDHQFYETIVSPQAGHLPWYALAGMLGIAFVGGLILNIMPCVLPVLSLKILAFLREDKVNLTAVRRDFLATVAGIMSSFVLLAGIMVLIRSTSSTIGWGFQFQEPLFLITLITILTIFAGNLFGFIEFRAPLFLSGAGNKLSKFQGSVRSFLEGTLVTILATPCTAPFVGTAVGFAFTQPYVTTLMIFIAMATGLAFPFLLIAAFPNTAQHFPKPGPWMLKVKIVLGFSLLGTAGWLNFILMSQVGGYPSYLIFLVMAFILLSLAYVKTLRKVLWAVIFVFISSLYILPALAPQTPTVSTKGDQYWQDFEPQKIASFVQQNKVVFVDVTADWCLTCKTNELFALKNDKVKKQLESQDVVAMKADWTTRDARITHYLEQFNQLGIPFYVVYGCHAPEGKVLGPILTPGAVISALNNAKCPIKPS